MLAVHQSMWFLVIAGIIDCFGILSNFLILCYLTCNSVGSKLTTRLMTNQFIFDGLASGFALCSLLCPDDLMDHLGSLTGAFCHLWVSRAIFWFVVLLSETNLVCIAVDRLRAVEFSSSYRQLERTTLGIYYACILAYSFLCAVPSAFTVDYKGSHCEHTIMTNPDSKARQQLLFYAYLWLFTGYLIPGLVMVGCHTKVVVTMRKMIHKKTVNFGKNIIQVSDSAQNHRHAISSGMSNFNHSIVVSAIAMSSAFLITHSYHVIFYLLYVQDVIEFIPNSVERRTGILLTILNSACNPVIMVISSPPFRRGLWKSLRSCKFNNRQTSQASDACSRENNGPTERNQSNPVIVRSRELS